LELAQAIANYRVVGVDSNVFIYAYQEHLQYLPVVRPLFARLDTDPEFRAVTSIISLIEITVLPLRLNRYDLVSAYTTALLNSPHLTTYPVDIPIARKAAELRAKENLRTPDAIQIATAIVAGAQAFVTNDARLKNVQDIPILIVSDFLSA
jgi:predicted nucleic acid-binding protein